MKRIIAECDVELLPHGGGDEGSGEEPKPFFETHLKRRFGNEREAGAVTGLR